MTVEVSRFTLPYDEAVADNVHANTIGLADYYDAIMVVAPDHRWVAVFRDANDAATGMSFGTAAAARAFLVGVMHDPGATRVIARRAGIEATPVRADAVIDLHAHPDDARMACRTSTTGHVTFGPHSQLHRRSIYA